MTADSFSNTSHVLYNFLESMGMHWTIYIYTHKNKKGIGTNSNVSDLWLKSLLIYNLLLVIINDMSSALEEPNRYTRPCELFVVNSL